MTRTTRLSDGVLQDIGDKYDKAPAQVLIRWCLQLGVVPLPKANRISHLEDNLDVFDFELDDKDMEALNSINEQYSALGSKPVYESSKEDQEKWRQ